MKNVYGVQAHDKPTRNDCQNLNKNPRPEKSLTLHVRKLRMRHQRPGPCVTAHRKKVKYQFLLNCDKNTTFSVLSATEMCWIAGTFR